MYLKEDNQNKAVITTKQIIHQGRDIAFVKLDEDGDWQFFGDDDFTTEDAMLVSVAQILKYDKSLESLPHIEIGESVYRKNKESLWEKIM